MRDRRFESNSRLFRHIKKHQGFRHYRRSDKWVLSPVLSPKEGHKRPWMVRTRRARATIHPSPANLAVATDVAKDFENLAETLATFVTLASIQPALRRLAKAEPAPRNPPDEGRQIA